MSIQMNPTKRWMMIIGLFLVVQLIFFVVDGTYLEPNIDDSNRLYAVIGRWILESKLFTEWIALYSFPFFNMFMTIHVIAIFIQALQDIIKSDLFVKK